MLFKKSIEPRCAYCQRAKPLEGDTFACPKKGVVHAAFSCRSFQYDPLKRKPQKPIRQTFQKEDFII